MTQRNARLELTWIGKEQRPKLEPRILLLSGEEKGFAAGWLAAYTTCACGSYIYVGENPNVLTRYYAKRSLIVWN